MAKIFCIMGKSGSGKDTIFRELLKDKSLGLKPCLIYTTRPRRKGEKDGVDYRFITEKELAELSGAGKVIETRRYDTIRGVWYYCTVEDGQFEGPCSHIVITTLASYISLRNYFGKDKVVPVYICVDDGERLRRALNREMSEEHPDYEEMCRRFLADSADFSVENLKNGGICRFYKNDNLEGCINEVRKDIIKELQCDCGQHGLTASKGEGNAG